jgi:hypothetical protein
MDVLTPLPPPRGDSAADALLDWIPQPEHHEVDIARARRREDLAVVESG